MTKLKKKRRGMFGLKLNTKHCISCGVCMDVCAPQAIDMRINQSNTVEGEMLSYVWLRTDGREERPIEKMMTFPFLVSPGECDGCLICVYECPVNALIICSN